MCLGPTRQSGPGDSVKAFLAGHPNFVSDRSVEYLLYTQVGTAVLLYTQVGTDVNTCAHCCNAEHIVLCTAVML